jgi:hypothetical protein
MMDAIRYDTVKLNEQKEAEEIFLLRNLCVKLSGIIAYKMMNKDYMTYLETGEISNLSGKESESITAYLANERFMKLLYDFYRFPVWKKAYVKESLCRNIMENLMRSNHNNNVKLTSDTIKKIEETVNDFLKEIHSISAGVYYSDEYMSDTFAIDEVDRKVAEELQYDFYTSI